MNWKSLESIEQLHDIKSAAGYSVIFKHSTRCSISFMAKKKFEFEWESLPAETPVYYLDLLSFRHISNTVADIFKVHHESPQVLLIKDGECIFESSHGQISAEELAEQMAVNS